MIWTRSALVAVAVLVCGCRAAAPPAPAAERQVYRASVETPDGDEIPFFLELPSNCNVDRAAVVNGRERIPVPCQRHGSQVLIDFVVYGTRVSADVGADGRLAGSWSHVGGSIADDRRRFAAQPLDRLDSRLRFPIRSGEPAIDVAGTWRIEFDSHDVGKARFEPAAAGVVNGTAEVPSEYGDLRFLAGIVDGSSLSLSTFDGSIAYLIRGQVDADGRMRGELIRGDGTRDAFGATRSRDFDVVDPLRRVRVISAQKRLDFAPLSSARYDGKAVIIELFGTWCSNCNDLAPLLVDLYRRHREQGLEVLGLAYEMSADDAYRRERVAAYRAQHGVEWEVLIPKGPPEDLFAVGPAQVAPIEGVPVTLFLNRDRTIRAIYTGFWGPATGGTHEKAVATFQRLTKEILASQR